MGKDERFHRTFKDAIQSNCEGRLIEECQPIFDDWRTEYNTERPHEALDMDVPSDHYESSERTFPETIHEWDYVDCEAVRKVSETGLISFQSQIYPIGTGFAGKYIGLEETSNEDEMTAKFRQFDVKTLHLDEDQLDY